MGATQSANWIGFKTPSATSLSSSLSTSVRMAYGTCLGLQNTGLTFASTCRVALCPFRVPRPSWKSVCVFARHLPELSFECDKFVFSLASDEKASHDPASWGYLLQLLR